ncbi:hypothetical protein K435DRAFT_408245 [Dendrothele bispora CBS 962.96]|uniref:Uncharacterized protein n=1 Tax=Dendrothele bispora (strain CBS 962.96) TaxID=1314807 RepID=A0A4V6T534_DENBC|nr:hypothetical protein K435DRAFT_408245 [Dendrothele bispora CBS 962.96]
MELDGWGIYIRQSGFWNPEHGWGFTATLLPDVDNRGCSCHISILHQILIYCSCLEVLQSVTQTGAYKFGIKVYTCGIAPGSGGFMSYAFLHVSKCRYYLDG